MFNLLNNCIENRLAWKNPPAWYPSVEEFYDFCIKEEQKIWSLFKVRRQGISFAEEKKRYVKSAQETK